MKIFKIHFRFRYKRNALRSFLFGFLSVIWGFLIMGCAMGGGPPGPPLLGPNPLLDTLRFLSPFLNLVLILLIIGGGIYFFSANRFFGRKIGKYSAKDIARMRYANGEISREEYLRIVKDLEITEADEIENEREDEEMR